MAIPPIAALKGADTLWECGATPFEVAQQVIVLDDLAWLSGRH